MTVCQALKAAFLATAALAASMLATVTGAQAATITANMTADNAFYAYVSTNDSTLGTLIGSGNNWQQAVAFSGTLTSGVTNYLHVVAINYGGPDGFLGNFSLSGTGFTFANGLQTLNTGIANWKVTYDSANSTVAPQAWVKPTGSDSVLSLGPNATNGSTSPWGYVSGITPSAEWIWGNAAQTNCQSNGGYCTVSFSTAIYAAVNTVPTPGTIALLGVGLLGLGAMRRRQLDMRA